MKNTLAHYFDKQRKRKRQRERMRFMFWCMHHQKSAVTFANNEILEFMSIFPGQETIQMLWIQSNGISFTNEPCLLCANKWFQSIEFGIKIRFVFFQSLLKKDTPTWQCRQNQDGKEVNFKNYIQIWKKRVFWYINLYNHLQTLRDK